MGKTSRFFKAFFGFKSPAPSDVDKQTKRRWTFFKSHTSYHHLSDASLNGQRDTPLHHRHSDQTAAVGLTNHDIAVAAVAVPHAAAEVVRMTTRTTTVVGADYRFSYELAAVKIQSYFRGYLARKALRALKSLVKLQALVRGHLTRKEAADDLRRLQALVRAHARIRACRVQLSESPQSTTKVKVASIHGPPTPEKYEHVRRLRTIKHNQSSILKNKGSNLYDERNEKVLEIDSTKPNIRRRTLFQPDQISNSKSQSLTNSRGSTIHPLGLSPSGSYEVTSLTAPLKYFGHDMEEQVSFGIGQNSPFYAISSNNGSMRISPFTPAKSDSSRSCISGYSDNPNYMAYTESSRAKVRSVSAPRQRPNFEFPSTTKRFSVYGYGSGGQRGSNLRDSFASKAYPGSGRLDRLGMPVGGVGYCENEFSSGYWN
ncbi:hypothetical protein R6Q57_023515 [Mikania cordata]